MIGDKIKSLRKEKGLTQQQLADKLNISRNSLINYENNYTPIKSNILQSISNLFDIPIYELIGESDSAFEEYLSLFDSYLKDNETEINNINNLSLNLYSKPSELKEYNKEMESIIQNFKDLSAYQTLLRNPILEKRFKYNFNELKPEDLASIYVFLDQILEMKLNDMKFKKNLEQQK